MSDMEAHSILSLERNLLLFRCVHCINRVTSVPGEDCTTKATYINIFRNPNDRLYVNEMIQEGKTEQQRDLSANFTLIIRVMLRNSHENPPKNHNMLLKYNLNYNT